MHQMGKEQRKILMQTNCQEVFELDWDCLPAHLTFHCRTLREHQMLMWPMWVELEESILQEVEILPSVDHDSIYIDHSLKQSHMVICLTS